MTYLADLVGGQKTGFFLDQRENGMRRRMSERSHLLVEDRRCLATFGLDEAPWLVIVDCVQHEQLGACPGGDERGAAQRAVGAR